MNEALILSACRTPIGKFGGAFKELTAVELGAVAVREALCRADAPKESVDEVLMGNVIQAGQRQNPARQAALGADLPNTVPCTTINKVCGSGLKTVALAAGAVRLGDGECIIAGGLESMSHAPFVLPRGDADGLGHATLLDCILHDGLLDAFDGRHMAQMCERVAEKYNVTRNDMDKYAAKSQQLCEAARLEGKFDDEIVPVSVPDRKETRIIETDEHPRPGTTVESLSKLRAVFDANGCITAGNASGINDGAAAIVVASEKAAEQFGTNPMARIVSWGSAATEPEMFSVAPTGAVRNALDKAGLTLGDIDLIESNEAFAAQTLALTKDVGWDIEKVNVNGGAIALGHPIGASGTRILTTLLYELGRRQDRYGLATLCCGGGMGIALIVERLAN